MDKNKYSHEIWKRLKQQIETRYGTKKAATISIVAPLVINGIAYVVFFLLWGLDTANQQILGFFIGTVMLEVVLLGAFLISWRFYDIPEAIYAEQLAQLNQLEPEDPFEFIVKPPYHFKTETAWVGIDILNNSTYSINCSILIQTKTMQRPKNLDGLQNSPIGNNYAPITITRKTGLSFYFACSEKGGPNAVLNTIDEAERRIYPGKYGLKIIVNGESSNGKPVAHSDNFLLIYEGDDKLELIKL